jgi:hypothetical protein
MSLPPTHHNFPHPSLIHAICSAAAAWQPAVGKTTESGEFKPWNPTVDFGKPREYQGSSPDQTTFGTQQSAFAKESVQDGLNTGNRLFDVVRAMVRVIGGQWGTVRSLRLSTFLSVCLGRTLLTSLDHSLSSLYRRHPHARMLGVQRSRVPYDPPTRIECTQCRTVAQVRDAASAGRCARARGKESGGVDGNVS